MQQITVTYSNSKLCSYKGVHKVYLPPAFHHPRGEYRQGLPALPLVPVAQAGWPLMMQWFGGQGGHLLEVFAGFATEKLADATKPHSVDSTVVGTGIKHPSISFSHSVHTPLVASSW